MLNSRPLKAQKAFSKILVAQYKTREQGTCYVSLGLVLLELRENSPLKVLLPFQTTKEETFFDSQVET